jgi:hypothetical protein
MVSTALPSGVIFFNSVLMLDTIVPDLALLRHHFSHAKQTEVYFRNIVSCLVSHAGIMGELKDKNNPEEMYEHVLDDKMCELIVQQKINEKASLKNLKSRSQDKDRILTNKEEIKLFFVILLLQGIVQKPKMGNYFSCSR